MPVKIEKVEGEEDVDRITLDALDGGWSTRTYPHLLPINKLVVADNVCYPQDGVIAKRFGNVAYGSWNHQAGRTGSGFPIQAVARYYPTTGNNQLVAISNGQLYAALDAAGIFSPVAPTTGGQSFSNTNNATFAQMYDPDMTTGAATALIICDGTRVPYEFDGTNLVPMATTGLPFGRDGVHYITPAYVKEWGPHLVFAGQPDEPTGLYISDALRPQRFTGFGFEDSQGTTYTPYFPGGRDGTLGHITGLAVLGPYLIIFFQAGIVAAICTGSYGAFQYQFWHVSNRTGATSPRSIVAFEDYVAFFGGDRFYATDAQTVQPFGDELPTVYGPNVPNLTPTLIQNISTVFGMRIGTQYLACYDPIISGSGSGGTLQCIVYDTGANGGYTYGESVQGESDTVERGGAWARWLNMQVACGIECRGPNDFFQVFWGDNQYDRVAQYAGNPTTYGGAGVFSDFGGPINMVVQAKSLFMDIPATYKELLRMWVMCALTVPVSGAYTINPQPFCVFDQVGITFTPGGVTVQQAGVLYGQGKYGQFLYEYGGGTSFASGTTFNPQILQATIPYFPEVTPSSYPSPFFTKGLSLSMGVAESSTLAFNIIGLVAEVKRDKAPQTN